MKVYTRLTPRDWHETKVKYSTPQAQRIILTKCWRLENALESGELCDREEVKRETAKEILLLLGKGFDETARKDFKDLQWYKQFCRELELRYGIELFGKTEQVENFDKLGGDGQ